MTYNDEHRHDAFPEASCISVSFPNYKMFYRYRCLNINFSWVILSISPETLVDHPSLFFPSNAASNRFRHKNDVDWNVHMGLSGLTSMFSDEPAGLRKKRGLRLELTTDPQAEVLVFSTISPQRFDKVILFRDNAEASRLVQERWPNIQLSVNTNLFKPRPDHNDLENVNLSLDQYGEREQED